MNVKCGRNDIEITEKNLIRSNGNVAWIVDVKVPTITCRYNGASFKSDEDACICESTWKRIKKNFHQVQIANPRPGMTYWRLNKDKE